MNKVQYWLSRRIRGTSVTVLSLEYIFFSHFGKGSFFYIYIVGFSPDCMPLVSLRVHLVKYFTVLGTCIHVHWTSTCMWTFSYSDIYNESIFYHVYSSFSYKSLNFIFLQNKLNIFILFIQQYELLHVFAADNIYSL